MNAISAAATVMRPMSFEVERYDIDQAGYTFENNYAKTFHTHVVDAFPVVSGNKLVDGEAPKRLEEPFLIQFQCTDPDTNKCEMARRGLQAAGKRIGQQLFITKQIKVRASFRPFCAAQAGSTEPCTMRKTLGAATPASYLRAQTEPGEPFFFYPQSLVKQLNSGSDVPFQEYDILAEFNSDYNFWFRTSRGAIQPGMVDFEYTVTHEVCLNDR
jgi:hypothetical protein